MAKNKKKKGAGGSGSSAATKTAEPPVKEETPGSAEPAQAETPKTAAPKEEPAKADAPKADAPKTDAPKADAPAPSGDSSGVDAGMVKQLRDETGAKLMDCKKALVEAGGDVEKAKDLLRKKGQASAVKRSGRATSEGTIYSYIHGGGKLGVMIELGCESDFVARNAEFQELAKDICMHITAAAPIALTRDDVPQENVDREREIAAGQVKGKPENIVEKIVQGKVDKYFAEVALLEQPFVKDNSITINELIQQKIGKIGENITLKRFIRWQLGE